MFSFIETESILMSKVVSVVRIVFVMAQTIFSLWSILGIKAKKVRTEEKEDRKQEDFKKDKKNVIISITLIILGSSFQIAGLFI